MTRKKKSTKGLASADAATRKRVSAAGGKAAHASGNAPEFTGETARKAGARGGKAAHANRTASAFTSEQARAAARKSAEVRRAKKAARESASTPVRDAFWHCGWCGDHAPAEEPYTVGDKEPCVECGEGTSRVMTAIEAEQYETEIKNGTRERKRSYS